MIEWIKNDFLWFCLGASACIVLGVPYYFLREWWRRRQWEKRRK